MADQYPELIFSGLMKLAKVTRIEVGSPGAFAKLGKADIVQKLEERGGPEARKLFEKFVADVEKLQAQQEEKGG